MKKKLPVFRHPLLVQNSIIIPSCQYLFDGVIAQSVPPTCISWEYVDDRLTIDGRRHSNAQQRTGNKCGLKIVSLQDLQDIQVL